MRVKGLFRGPSIYPPAFAATLNPHPRPNTRHRRPTTAAQNAGAMVISRVELAVKPRAFALVRKGPHWFVLRAEPSGLARAVTRDNSTDQNVVTGARR